MNSEHRKNKLCSRRRPRRAEISVASRRNFDHHFKTGQRPYNGRTAGGRREPRAAARARPYDGILYRTAFMLGGELLASRRIFSPQMVVRSKMRLGGWDHNRVSVKLFRKNIRRIGLAWLQVENHRGSA